MLDRSNTKRSARGGLLKTKELGGNTARFRVRFQGEVFGSEQHRHERLALRFADMSDFTVEIEQESDGRWITEIPELPGVLAYGATADESVAKAKALAFRVLADRLEHGENIPEIQGVFAVHE